MHFLNQFYLPIVDRRVSKSEKGIFVTLRLLRGGTDVISYALKLYYLGATGVNLNLYETYNIIIMIVKYYRGIHILKFQLY